MGSNPARVICPQMLFSQNFEKVPSGPIAYLYTELNHIGARVKRTELISSSGISNQQSVGLSPGHDTCVLKQDT